MLARTSPLTFFADCLEPLRRKNPLGALRFGNFYRQACPRRVGTEGDQPIPTLGLITDLGALLRWGGQNYLSFALAVLFQGN